MKVKDEVGGWGEKGGKLSSFCGVCLWTLTGFPH